MTTPHKHERTLWVTGAGSGMGRAIALSAAAQGYRVALSGRREQPLEETAALITGQGGTAVVVPLDATDTDAVLTAHNQVAASLGRVTHLVLSAGLNNPRRFWGDQSMADFNAIVQTNLVASAAVVSAVLPSMREASDGVVVFVSSFAAWRFNPGSGIAYSASKAAVSMLAESLNAEENRNGVRACHFCPSDTDTDFLSMRPNVPGEEARASMLTPDDVAAAVQFVLDAPAHVCVNEFVMSPTGALR
jgi:NADP-dependent 3-hydroxy acid dehydrogenase YdfG